MADLKVKCPKCGKIFIIADQPGIDSKTFTCLVCQTRSLIGQNRFVPQQRQPSLLGEETQYGPISGRGITSEDTQYAETLGKNGKETIVDSLNKLACLIDNSGKNYRLNIGINTIGRKANSSTATVQIAVEDKYMSRNHAVVEVRNVGGQIIYIVKNGANKNPSYLNGSLIGEKDQLILNDGDRLKLGYTELTFKK